MAHVGMQHPKTGVDCKCLQNTMGLHPSSDGGIVLFFVMAELGTRSRHCYDRWNWVQAALALIMERRAHKPILYFLELLHLHIKAAWVTHIAIFS